MVRYGGTENFFVLNTVLNLSSNVYTQQSSNLKKSLLSLFNRIFDFFNDKNFQSLFFIFSDIVGHNEGSSLM